MLWLVACAPSSPVVLGEPDVETATEGTPWEGDTTVATACDAPAPTAEVTAPNSGSAWSLGEAVPLAGTVEGVAPLVVEWIAEGTIVATGLDTAWTPEATGIQSVTLQVVDACGVTGSRGVTFTVVDVEAYEVESYLLDADWTDLTVDSRGVIWGATSLGLVRFDPAEESFEFPGHDALAVHVDSDGVWVGADSALTRLDPDSLVEITSTPTPAVRRIRDGQRDGRLVLATEDGMLIWEGGDVIGPVGASASALVVDVDEAIVVGTTDSVDVYEYDGDGNLGDDRVESLTIWSEPVPILDAAQNGRDLWFASPSGIGWADYISGEGMQLHTSMGGSFVTAANAVASSGLYTWIGTDEGLHMWDVYDGRMHRWDEWLPDIKVQAVAIGPDAVWVATPGGLVRVVGVPK